MLENILARSGMNLGSFQSEIERVFPSFDSSANQKNPVGNSMPAGFLCWLDGFRPSVVMRDDSDVHSVYDL